MKSRYVAPLIAFWTSLVLACVLFVAHRFSALGVIVLLAVVAANFVCTFFFVRYWFRHELYEKVYTIYKNIHSFKINRKELKNKVDADLVDMNEVSEEVEQWIEQQEGELDRMLALENYRKEYIGNVAHELKTPIFTIQGYISTLLDGAMEEKDLAKKYLLRTEGAIERMIAIVNDLTTISRLESGEIQLEIATFDIRELTLETMESLEHKAKEHNCEMILRYSEPLYVKADSNRIRQVLVNLLDNAINYSKAEGGAIEVNFSDMDNLVLVEIADKGIGVSEQELPRLFERFFRSDKARSRRSGGTGLGLAIVKHIIEAHRQTINVRSRLGEGTTFGFTLPKQ